jgi:hypothetical protein
MRSARSFNNSLIALNKTLDPLSADFSSALLLLCRLSQSGISALNDLLNQKDWLFKQNLVQPKTSATLATDTNKIPTNSKFIIPTANMVEQIDVDKISHTNVGDHYCHIFMKHQISIKEFFVKISLKEILDQFLHGPLRS